MDKTPENYRGSCENIWSPLVTNYNYNQGLCGTLDQIGEGFNYLYYYHEDDGYFESMPTGYRFMPKDEELICEYLLPKLNHGTLPRNRFHVVNIYGHSPEELSELYPSQGENSWYFFTERERKYKNGKKPNRATKNGEDIGYWKATGPDKPVMKTRKDGVIEHVGTRNALVYYKGKAPKGEKQPWIMHEYIANEHSIQPNGKDMKLDDCVLCKIYRKSERGKNEKCNAQAQEQLEPHSGIVLPMSDIFFG